MDPDDDVTEVKTTVIEPQEATGFVQVYPERVIFWLESKSNDYGVVIAYVSMNGLEH